MGQVWWTLRLCTPKLRLRRLVDLLAIASRRNYNGYYFLYNYCQKSERTGGLWILMGVINCLNVYKSSFGYRDVRSHQFVVSGPSDPVNTIHLSRVPHILPSINHPLKIQHIPSSPTIHCSFFVDTCTSVTMSSRDSSSSKGVPSNLVAFPSVSSALNSLPQATSIHNVSLHPNMYAQRAAESEAKVS